MKIKNFGVPDIFCNDEKFHAIIISKQLLVLEQVLTRLNNKSLISSSSIGNIFLELVERLVLKQDWKFHHCYPMLENI